MKSVLIVEPNPYHGITLPGMSEYFQRLGYKVTILIRPEVAKDNPFGMYLKNKIPQILVRTPEQIKKTLSSEYIAKFSYLFINSSAYWEPGVYQNSYLKYLNFIPQPKLTSLFLEHNLDYLDEDDCSVFYKQGRVCTLFNFKYLGKKTISIFPFGFPNIRKRTKNKIVNFITVGAIRRENRNFDLLFNSANRLIVSGITNFKIHVVGSGELKIHERLKKNIVVHGRLDYPHMFSLLGRADYYLPLLDPYIASHQRYLTGTTTGSMLLILGFSIPPIINEIFSKKYGFNSNNAILYKENNMTEAMVRAIKLGNKKYKTFVGNLVNYKKETYLKSLYNLKKMQKHVSNINQEELRKADEKQLSMARMAKINILRTEVKRLRRSLAIDDGSFLFKFKNAFNRRSVKLVDPVMQSRDLNLEIDRLENYKRKLIKTKKILPILPLFVRFIDLVQYIFSSVNQPIKNRIDPYVKNVVILGVIPFEFRHQRPQHLAIQIARNGWKTTYINTVPFSFPSLRSLGQHQEITHIELSLTGNPIITLQLPNDKIVEEAVTFIKKVITPKTVFKIDHPFWSFITEQFTNPVIYDCMDDHGSFEAGNPGFVALEKDLASKCALVTASSNILAEKMKQYGARHIVTLKNAGGYEHFAEAQNRSTTAPLDLVGMKGKIFGYYGAIAEWFDENIVLDLAKQFLNNSIVLIGQVSHPTIQQKLASYPNVRFLGEKPYKSLPRYLAQFDVCLIPFVVNSLTKATNPVKIYEYFASGKPVVATDLPELYSIKDLVYLAKNNTEFVAYTKKALDEKDPSLTKRRIAFAKKNTWEKRGSELAKIIESIQVK